MNTIEELFREKFPDGIPPALISQIKSDIDEYAADDFSDSESETDNGMTTITMGAQEYVVPKQFVNMAKCMWKLDIFFINLTKIFKETICVRFITRIDFEKFMNIIFMDMPVNDTSGICNRVFRRELPDDWRYEFHFGEFIKKRPNTQKRIHRIGSVILVKFPISDYDLVYKKMKSFYGSRKDYDKILSNRTKK